MKPPVAESLRRILQGSELQPEELLWGLLICAFLFSTIHLLTLFLTRWGERRITGKALLFSLMIHFAFAVGIVTTAPTPAVPPGAAVEDEHHVLVHSVPAEPDRIERMDTGAKDNPRGLGSTPPSSRTPPISFNRV